jgi:hypothetical protein
MIESLPPKRREYLEKMLADHAKTGWPTFGKASDTSPRNSVAVKVRTA